MYHILIKLSKEFVPETLVEIKSALVQVMAWHWTGAKPLPEPMVTEFLYLYTSPGHDVLLNCDLKKMSAVWKYNLSVSIRHPDYQVPWDLMGQNFQVPGIFFKSPSLTKNKGKLKCCCFPSICTQIKDYFLVLIKWLDKNVWMHSCNISTTRDAVYFHTHFYTNSTQMDQLQLHRSHKPAHQSTTSYSSKSLTSTPCIL